MSETCPGSALRRTACRGRGGGISLRGGLCGSCGVADSLRKVEMAFQNLPAPDAGKPFSIAGKPAMDMTARRAAVMRSQQPRHVVSISLRRFLISLLLLFSLLSIAAGLFSVVSSFV